MKQLKNKSTEEKIIEAAKVVFMKYGLYGARMQDIADNAQINKALLHYYFRTKEKLFDTIFEGALVKFFEKLEVFSNEDLPILERISIYIDTIIDFYSEYPHMSMFIIKEIGNNPEVFREKVLKAKKNKSIGMIKALEEAINNGELKSFDTAMFLINLQSLCSYPFIASSMFKHSLKAHGKDWDKDFSTDKLKISVKLFIDHTLKK